VEANRSIPWQSNTFTGSRHQLLIRTTDAAAADFTAEPTLDLAIRGHIVADLAAYPIETEAGSTLLRIEALTVEGSPVRGQAPAPRGGGPLCVAARRPGGTA
jgi:hypothetical protein